MEDICIISLYILVTVIFGKSKHLFILTELNGTYEPNINIFTESCIPSNSIGLFTNGNCA